MFKIQRKNRNQWHNVPFAESKIKAYCDGYLDACDTHYPCDPMQIVKTEKDGMIVVVRETKGRGEIHY